MSNDQQLLEQSSRIALAAFLHDLGKFAERARIPVNQDILDANKQMYCPHHKKFTDDKGWYSHVHAAYTGLALDIIEANIPQLTGANCSPFGSWKTREVDDSFINAAAMHHKPKTFLQWVIAMADRVASGFDREEFDQYNQGEEGTETGKNHYTARQLTLFEQIHLQNEPEKSFQYRYSLKPFSPESIFPLLASKCEGDDNKAAQKEYLDLWQNFIEALKKIPASHRSNWSLWLDHFETLWGVFTQAIPSATAFKVRPDVSLYDHSRVAAALATAIWRYHHETATTTIEDVQNWSEEKLLLIQGDFFGIQDFIFASGGDTNKRAAKLLRGRSFYVSLLSECAALKILDALDLPSTSQVINAAGKFMIVAPNTAQTKARLEVIKQELDTWFLERSWGQAGVGIAWVEAACKDFQRKPQDSKKLSPYQILIKKLFAQMEVMKCQRFNLCDSTAPAIFTEFLNSFDNTKGVCKIDGHSPASQLLDSDTYISELAFDQIEIGDWLTRRDRILITRQSLGMTSQLRIRIFGYYISFAEPEEAQGKFGEQAKSGNLLRAWDFSLPKSQDGAIWNGYARRNINAYIPIAHDTDMAEAQYGKYIGIDEALELGESKTLNHLACSDRTPNSLREDQWIGINSLSTLKGDVDNLGMIFQSGLGHDVSFSKTAALSRQMNNFFAVYLPWLCQKQYPNCYTVFAGGDDFFLIGPWWSQIKLADEMQQAFQRYVAFNSEVHFSAGISTTKPGLPITQLRDLAETALDEAKSHNPKQSENPPKNAVSCFNQIMFWDQLHELVTERLENLQQRCEDNGLSTGYVYGLLQLIDMETRLNDNSDKIKNKFENAIWHSYFSYRTARMLERKKIDKSVRARRHAELAQEIVVQGIKKHQSNYRVTLFCHLYQQRD